MSLWFMACADADATAVEGVMLVEALDLDHALAKAQSAGAPWAMGLPVPETDTMSDPEDARAIAYLRGVVPRDLLIEQRVLIDSLTAETQPV